LVRDGVTYNLCFGTFSFVLVFVSHGGVSIHLILWHYHNIVAIVTQLYWYYMTLTQYQLS